MTHVACTENDSPSIVNATIIESDPVSGFLTLGISSTYPTCLTSGTTSYAVTVVGSRTYDCNFTPITPTLSTCQLTSEPPEYGTEYIITFINELTPRTGVTYTLSFGKHTERNKRKREKTITGRAC